MSAITDVVPRHRPEAKARPKVRLKARLRRRPGRARERIRVECRPLTARAVASVWSLTAISVLALWVVGYGLGLSALQEASAQHRLYNTLRYDLATETPLPSPIPIGTPVAALTIPSIHLSRAVVVEGTSSSALRAGPGHEADTPLPGEVGVSVLAGRSVMFGGPFGDVPRLMPGAAIDVTTIEGTFHYKVLDVRSAGDALPPVVAAGGSRIVLVTSAGHGWRTGWAPTEAVYVDADLVGRAVTADAHPSVIPTSQLPMRTETGGLSGLVFWLEALLLLAGAATLAARRLSHRQAWLLAVPAIVAVLWGASNAAAPLLPNLM